MSEWTTLRTDCSTRWGHGPPSRREYAKTWGPVGAVLGGGVLLAAVLIGGMYLLAVLVGPKVAEIFR